LDQDSADLEKNMFIKKEEINTLYPEKPAGFSKDKKRILSNPPMKLDPKSGCYVSVENLSNEVSFEARNFFRKHGYLVIYGISDKKIFYESPPKERGQITYYGSENNFQHLKDEGTVEGSISRCDHPRLKFTHSQIRLKIEKILGEKLYNTYYYDRFYFKGQRLLRHLDREACEISLTYQVSSNSKKPWPICFETPNGEERYINLEDGQAVLYKGVDLEHWREPLISRYNFFEKSLNKLKLKEDDTYHHQIFFHYVRQNGEFAHCAYDRTR
jgi:hypothetical protein